MVSEIVGYLLKLLYGVDAFWLAMGRYAQQRKNNLYKAAYLINYPHISVSTHGSILTYLPIFTYGQDITVPEEGLVELAAG